MIKPHVDPARQVEIEEKLSKAGFEFMGPEFKPAPKGIFDLANGNDERESKLVAAYHKNMKIQTYVTELIAKLKEADLGLLAKNTNDIIAEINLLRDTIRGKVVNDPNANIKVLPNIVGPDQKQRAIKPLGGNAEAAGVVDGQQPIANDVLSKFNESIMRLAEIKLPEKISIEGTIQHNHTVLGTDAIGQAVVSTIKGFIDGYVNEKLNKVINPNTGETNSFTPNTPIGKV
jgi:hypothetical protein